jgi:predicted nucleic acid-binding protein
VILVDANIFMYAAGKAHPHKEPCCALIERIALGQVDALVDAEVLQEILHRYRAILKWEDGRKVYDLARKVVPVVVPVTADLTDLARALLDEHPGLMARDALHAAACRYIGAEAICSYDRDFDAIDGIKRIEPADLVR